MPSISKPFITDENDSPAYWQIGNLWRIMATGVQTDNSFTLLDQIVRAGAGGGPVTHTHTQDEGLYVISGQCTFNAGGKHGLIGSPGTFVAIPGECEHSFWVDKPDTQVLNFYLPAGFEQIMIGIAHPAEERVPPPVDKIREMLPPRLLADKLCDQYGQVNTLGNPFTDPPDKDKMYTKATSGATVFPFISNANDSDRHGIWLRGSLYTILASGESTGGSYSVIEQRFCKGPVNAPHIFDDKDEIYYIFDGEMTFLLDEKVKTAKKGALVFVPRGHVSAVTVTSETALCLNIVTPGGFDKFVQAIGTPAEKKELAPMNFKDKEVDAGLMYRLKKECGLREVAVASPF